MPYFPYPSEPRPHLCEGCKKWYVISGGVSSSCCVLHPPGTCCHFGETEVKVVHDAGGTPVILAARLY